MSNYELKTAHVIRYLDSNKGHINKAFKSYDDAKRYLELFFNDISGCVTIDEVYRTLPKDGITFNYWEEE